MNRTVMTMWCGGTIGATIMLVLTALLPTGWLVFFLLLSVGGMYAVARLIPGAMEP